MAWLVVAAATAAAFAPSARAQMMGGAFDPGTLMRQGVKQGAPTAAAPQAASPALPGASSRADTVAPATRIPSEMSPNAALFDAINRGDVNAARDALNRGAQLSAQNVLGLTPLELSVDLGRNDISFLLMSYRDADGGSTGAPRTVGATTPPASAKLAAAALKGRHGPVVAAKAVVPPAPPRAPRLFADDGGAPVPGAGFLGFNSAQAETR
jgi:hypothetical protein